MIKSNSIFCSNMYSVEVFDTADHDEYIVCIDGIIDVYVGK